MLPEYCIGSLLCTRSFQCSLSMTHFESAIEHCSQLSKTKFERHHTVRIVFGKTGDAAVAASVCTVPWRKPLSRSINNPPSIVLKNTKQTFVSNTLNDHTALCGYRHTTLVSTCCLQGIRITLHSSIC